MCHCHFNIRSGTVHQFFCLFQDHDLFSRKQHPVISCFRSHGKQVPDNMQKIHIVQRKRGYMGFQQNGIGIVLRYFHIQFIQVSVQVQLYVNVAFSVVDYRAGVIIF